MSVIITAEAYRMIASMALFEFSEGRRLPNGDWEGPFMRSTMERIQKHQLTGETISETIIRLISLYRSGGKPN